MGTGALGLLSALLKPKEVRVDADLCLNRRHKGIACRSCADACPAGAIALVGATSLGSSPANTPAIDPDTCLHCNICQAACPTQAFTIPEVELVPLLTRARSKTSVTLACSKISSQEASRVPCLAAFTWEDLAVLALSGPRQVHLADGACNRCAYARHGAHDRIKAQAAAANSFLSSLAAQEAEGSEEMRIVLTDVSGPAESEAAGRSAGESFSRRDLFTLWKRRGAVALAESLPDLTWPDYPPPPGLPRRLPESRRRLLSLLASGGFTAGGRREPVSDCAPLPLVEWRVSSRCDGCGLCASLCPTDALRTEASGDLRTLTFQPAACLDCGLCDRTCPQSALERQLLPDTSSFLSGHRQILWESSQRACSRCGEPHTSEEDLCPACLKKRSLLTDMGRQLFPENT